MILQIRDLSITMGRHQILSIEELDLADGQRMGLVGESGSGKTMTAMSILGLLPTNAEMTGSIRFRGRELVGLSDAEMADIRGADLSAIFQDPARALNPMMRIGRQISEVLRIHSVGGKEAIMAEVIDLMRMVQLPDPESLIRRYPHQISGGQQQRVLIAMAIACKPSLLIADEPTTALDVTVQEAILRLLVGLSEESGMAMLFVSHDLGVVRSVSQEIAVVYGGNLVEAGRTDDVIRNPKHRYTDALIGANPGLPEPQRLEALMGTHLKTVEGSVPAIGNFPSGCRFRDRCRFEVAQCGEMPAIQLLDDSHRFKCWNPVGKMPDAPNR